MIDIDVQLVRGDVNCDPGEPGPDPAVDAPPEEVALWLRRMITARVRAMQVMSSGPEYGPDGRSLGCYPGGFFGRNLPSPICEWCRADRYCRRTTRCQRCNEPYYDDGLAWSGKTSLTVPSSRLTEFEASELRSVATRCMAHQGRFGHELLSAMRQEFGS